MEELTDAFKYGVRPCPFCGSLDAMINDSDEAFENHLIYISCCGCGAVMYGPDGIEVDDDDNIIFPETKESYIIRTVSAWNRRA